jgi:hypothetical protein
LTKRKRSFIVSACSKSLISLLSVGVVTCTFQFWEQLYSPQNTPVISQIKKKDKAVPLHAWRGPEGSWKLRFPDCMTTAQDGGTFVSLTHRPPLPPGNAPGTHFC